MCINVCGNDIIIINTNVKCVWYYNVCVWLVILMCGY